MPNFTGFSLNYAPIVHTDENGTPIPQEEKHTLSQGWLQAFNSLNQIVIGNWSHFRGTNNAEIAKCHYTPYGAVVYVKYNAARATDTLVLPATCYGVLSRFEGGVFSSYIQVEGSQVVITNPTAQTVITGTLST
jgi:hypothetical protein